MVLTSLCIMPLKKCLDFFYRVWLLLLFEGPMAFLISYMQLPYYSLHDAGRQSRLDTSSLNDVICLCYSSKRIV